MVKSKNHLCSLLKINKPDLKDILTNIPIYYGEWQDIKYNIDGTPKTRRGRILKRTYNPSLRRLKVLQKRINKEILKKLEYPKYIHGGIRNKSNITNAAEHLKSVFRFTTDLRDFFPSISYKDVYKMFLRYGFSHDVASVLTKLTTFKGCVPQGAPTSSYIANLTFTEVGSALNHLAIENGLTMTTYIDDISFSSKKCFKHLVPKITQIINEGKYAISQKKTFYTIGNCDMTGICVGRNKLSVTNKINDKIIKEEDHYSARYLGLINYKSRVENFLKSSNI